MAAESEKARVLNCHREPSVVDFAPLRNCKTIGIDGDTGAGKTTLAGELQSVLGGEVISPTDGTPGAEGLSGLAKAFIYAGARTLLVSHWPVASEPTVALTTRMLSESAKPGVGRAEAHRRAMLAYLADPANLALAHPAYWAGFAVIGEGGIAGR